MKKKQWAAVMGWFKKYQRLVDVDEEERAGEQASSFNFEIIFRPTNDCWENCLR